MGGFSAIPEELQRAAKAIDDTVSHVAGLAWQGPSGDYGHPGVQGGWGQFVDDAKAEVKKLADATQGHGVNLQQAASDYLKFDEHAAGLLGNAMGALGLGAAVGSAVGGSPFAGAEATGTATAGGSGFAGAEATGHAAAGGSGFAGAEATGHAAAGGSGFAGAEATGHAPAGGSGFAGAEATGHAPAGGTEPGPINGGTRWTGSILDGSARGKEVEL